MRDVLVDPFSKVVLLEHLLKKIGHSFGRNSISWLPAATMSMIVAITALTAGSFLCADNMTAIGTPSANVKLRTVTNRFTFLVSLKFSYFILRVRMAMKTIMSWNSTKYIPTRRKRYVFPLKLGLIRFSARVVDPLVITTMVDLYVGASKTISRITSVFGIAVRVRTISIMGSR